MTVQFVPLKLRSLVPAEPSALTDIFNVIINAYNAFGLSVSQSSVTVNSLGSFTVPNLPTSPAEGVFAYAMDGRKVGEGSGSGTGVMVYFSNGAWRVFSTDAPVLS